MIGIDLGYIRRRRRECSHSYVSTLLCSGGRSSSKWFYRHEGITDDCSSRETEKEARPPFSEKQKKRGSFEATMTLAGSILQKRLIIVAARLSLSLSLPPVPVYRVAGITMEKSARRGRPASGNWRIQGVETVTGSRQLVLCSPRRAADAHGSSPPNPDARP